MPELAEALATMSDETFAYHSNVQKQYFSNWIREIMGDKDLAKRLEKAASRPQAAQQAANRMSFLSKGLV
jgi:hypothetical protein